jgi:hypothetical protein
MKKNYSSSKAALITRITLSALLIATSFCLLSVSSLEAARSRLFRARSTSKAKATAPAVSVPTQFSGVFDPHAYPCATPRHHFIVPAGQVRIIVQVDAQLPANDLNVNLLFGPDPSPTLVAQTDTGIGNELLLYQPSGGVTAGEYQVQVCLSDAPAADNPPYDYTGTFTYDNTAPAGGVPLVKLTVIPPAVLDNGPHLGFENFSPPGVLTSVFTTEAGQQPNSVEYLGRNAGEPSIGYNPFTDTSVFGSGLQSLFVNFDDSCPANGLSATWVNRPATTQVAADSDPITFTDRATGRTFSSQLTLLSPTPFSKQSHTDDDGMTWTVDVHSDFNSGLDHQTIGGGPYRTDLAAVPPVVPPPHPLYQNQIYYCSQDIVSPPTAGPPSFCARSDDGGQNYGPSILVAVPPVNVCGGLHGHVKVAPDGTVYVPFNTCDGVGSVVVSEDNGVSWQVRHVQTPAGAVSPSASFQDPAIAIDAANKVYFAIANNDTAAAVLTSVDHGKTWQNLADVAAVYGLKNVRYPAAIAGAPDRAAVTFYATKTPGDALQPNFVGIWHLYIASTFDGGLTWSTVDATPNAPMQRGCIWAKGGANICRNLLDFYDVNADKDGRVLVGYINGCEGGPCVQAPVTVTGETPPGQGNAYTTTAAIARQSSGRRLFGDNNQIPATSKPGMPLLTQRRVGNVVHLQWSEADTGNLMVNNYQIIRRSDTTGPSVIGNVAGTQTGGTYDDTLPAADTATYYYKVVAQNTAGTSCGNNEVAAPYVGNTCSGIIIHRNDPAHREANTGTATPPSLLIDYVAVGEPPLPAGNLLMFKMKVNSLATLPPNSRWRIVWDSYTAQAVDADEAAQQWYVGMRTDANSVPVFEYGTLADAGVPAVFVISEQHRNPANPASNYQPDGTITIYVPRSAVGNPQPGMLLGAVNGRTFADDSVAHRSNLFIDHTFAKAQTDNGYPPATYLVSGNNFCSATGIAPIGAVSRKTHGTVGDFDVDLPLSGPEGIECRTGGANGDYKVLVTFPGPVTVASATCGAQPATTSVNGSVVTVNCTGLTSPQDTTINLVNVNDGATAGNVSIKMGVLTGDTNADRAVNSGDISQTKSQSGKAVTGSNFREDLNVDGDINSGDISVVKSKSGTGLP